MWTSTAVARSHGFDVRHAVGTGWQYGRIEIDGTKWAPFYLPTRQRALKADYFIWKDQLQEHRSCFLK